MPVESVEDQPTANLTQALFIVMAILIRSVDEDTHSKCATTLRRHLRSQGLSDKLQRQSRQSAQHVPRGSKLHDAEILKAVFELFGVQ